MGNEQELDDEVDIAMNNEGPDWTFIRWTSFRWKLFRWTFTLTFTNPNKRLFCHLANFESKFTNFKLKFRFISSLQINRVISSYANNNRCNRTILSNRATGNFVHTSVILMFWGRGQFYFQNCPTRQSNQILFFNATIEFTPKKTSALVASIEP